MENPFTTTENNKPKRSTLLSVLLVLTFIGSGFNFIGNGYTSLFFNSIIELIEETADDDTMTSLASLLERSVEMMEKAGPVYYGLVTLLFIVSVVGAVFMWTLNKLGFHLYASSQIILLVIPMAFGLVSFPDILGTVITAIFILLYARELKMNRLLAA